jgi:hypothetical protein
MNEIKNVLDKAVSVLSGLPGIQAVVLGGSRARGTHSPSSDIDIGIYYDSLSLDMDMLNQAAQKVDDNRREKLITQPGGWGEWVNGGGWLVIDSRSVDIILRDTVKVEKAVQECRKGLVSMHYQTGHPHAFSNAMYMGELAICKVLWETSGQISAMKRLAEQYPAEMQKTLVHLFSFEAEFSLCLAENSVESDDVYYVAAHVARSISALNQVLFALNGEYLLNEKKAVHMIDGFVIRAAGYQSKVNSIFAAVGKDGKNACERLRLLVNETKALLTAEQTSHVTATMDDLYFGKGKNEPNKECK